MNSKSIWTRSSASLTAIAMVATMGFAAPAFAAAAPNADNNDDGAIVVTARKREEDILKTPVTVTAMTSEVLDQRGIVAMTDLAEAQPGININNNSSGHADRSFQQIVLRGFTPSTTLATTTSMFIDGVAVSSPSAFTAISGPERIEILKGPQSAYFGRNTFAGAINVVNKIPSADWGATVTGMVGTRNNMRVRAEVEGPILGDVVTFRVSGEKYKKGGSYTNPFDGNTLGDESSTTGTLLVVAKPTERLTVKAFGMLSRDEDGAPAQTRLLGRDIKDVAGNILYKGQSNCTLTGNSTGSLGVPGVATSNPFICGVTPGLINPVSANTVADSILKNFLADPRNRVVGNGIDHYGLLRNNYHMHATADYELTDELTASLLAGTNHESWSTVIDLDAFDTSKIVYAAGPRGYFDYPYLIERKTGDNSFEARIAGDFGKFRMVAGASYLSAYQIAGGGGSVATPTYVNLVPGGKSKAVTKGAFVGLTYDLVENLSASVEGRYQSDKISAYTKPSGQTILGSTYIPAGVYPGKALLAEDTFNNFLWRGILNYQVTPDTMVYASLSKGVNPALFNANVLAQTANTQTIAKASGIGLTVDPEKITNYEVGFKGKALDGALRYSIAAYYAQWRKQINAILLTINDPTAANGVTFFTGYANSGNVNMKGLEFEATLKVNDLLSLNAAGAFNDSNILDFKSVSISKLTGVFDYSGKEMPNSSKYSANVGAQIGSDLNGLEDASWFARADFSYKSGVWSNQANIVKTMAAKVVNARIGASMGRTSVELFVNNVLNNKAYTTIGDNYVIDQNLSLLVNNAVHVGLPDLRTAGLQIKVGF